MSATTIEQPTVIAYVPPSSLKEHPEAWRIPEMSPDEWADFNESVRSRGAITDPVFALPDGRVFDGRHRLRAANENGLAALPVITWNISEDEALQRMCGSAILRRGLAAAQRLAVLLEFRTLVDQLQKDARERQHLNLLQGARTPDVPELEQRETGGRVNEQLAEMSGVGKSSVAYLKVVQRDEPELFNRVKAGDITINKAYAETKKRKQPADESRPAPKLPPETPKSATRAKLDEIKRTVESDELLDDVPGESTLSPSNLLRYRANGGIMRFAADFCADYEALKGADPETVRQYLIRLKRIIYGSLLIAAEYDESQELRDIFSHMAYLAECALSDEGALTLVTTIQKGGKVA